MSKIRTAQQNDNLRVFANHLDRLTFVENWLRPPGLNADIQNAAEATRMIVNADFELLGTNASSDDATIAAGGGVTIETDGASADSAIILPHLDASQSAWTAVKWNTKDEVAVAAKITTGASVADVTIYYGLKLTNTNVVATDADQVYFRYQDSQNGGRFEAVYSVDGTDHKRDTGIAVAASTSYKLEIAIDADRVPRFYINGDLVATGTALKDDVDLIPYSGVVANAAAAKKITVRPGYAISKAMND